MMRFCHCLPDSTDGIVHHTCEAVKIEGATSVPYVCPVCQGRTTLPAGFYDDVAAPSSATRETCRTCHGQGVLWGPSFPTRV